MLAELDMDSASIMTGLLHDTVEDTGATLDDLRELFGDEVALLVDGVTKLDKLELRQVLANDPSPKQKQSENLRKLVLAMARAQVPICHVRPIPSPARWMWLSDRGVQTIFPELANERLLG